MSIIQYDALDNTVVPTLLLNYTDRQRQLHHASAAELTALFVMTATVTFSQSGLKSEILVV